MKHKTLRCTAETAALLLTVAMLAFLSPSHRMDTPKTRRTPGTGL